jgi:glyoxylase-like metal-dependent hydrolase (beta-lactamase superfamily II)
VPFEQLSATVFLVGRGRWGGLTPLSGDYDANAYLVRGREGAFLVDAGNGPRCDRIAANVAEAGLDPRRVQGIVLTHLHFDHAGGATQWQHEHGTPVLAHPEAVRSLAQGDLRLMGLALHPQGARLTPPRIDAGLADGDLLPFGGSRLRTRFAPGHTPDLVCLRGEMDGVDVLFSSDCVIGNQGGVEGCIGWLDGCWRSDIHAYARTVEAIIADPPEALLPGHGRPIRGRAEVMRSLTAARRRIQYLLDIPDLGTMLPITGGDPSYREARP